jgi:multiple sugar transport system permease protein
MTDAVKPTQAVVNHAEGMTYLETLPRRLVTIYIPLALFIIVLLFPFYWMA